VSSDPGPRGDADADADEAAGGPDGADALERVIVTASVLLTAGTLGYVVWQAVATPAVAAPVATVDSAEPMSGDDRVRVRVRLDNGRGTGLASVRVAVRCSAAERSLEFTHVPAGGHRTGSVVRPTGTTPEAAVEA